MQVFLFSNWLKSIKSRTIQLPTMRPSLCELSHVPVNSLPVFVRECSVAQKYIKLLGLLDWSRFPERQDQRFALDVPPLPYACLAAAYLVKLEQHIPYVADLRAYLVEHPALIWVLGFQLKPSGEYSWGFDAEHSLPTHRHISRMLRDLPNACLQFLLDETVRLIQAEIKDEFGAAFVFGDCISLDTKHIIAWVKENNPKAYIEGKHYDKTEQPAGDPDCKLGCKRKHNQRKKAESVETLPTPTKDAQPANHVKAGEYYWGYGSGVVATKIPDWGEFVLAELTQTFDQSDVSYFKPLMAQVERRLGHKPNYGAFDAAFDAFYVYEYFDPTKGFAAIPFVERGSGGKDRRFAPDGSPLCAAGLKMHLRYTFLCKTTLIPHQRGRYACPLHYPHKTADSCPINDPHWLNNGCVSTLATSTGARLRYQIDRSSQKFKDILKQRTATERINSQAVALGIERPKLRNAASIANHNTLTYVLINLHALQRIRQHKAECKQAKTA
jgi:hypothetical protein